MRPLMQAPSPSITLLQTRRSLKPVELVGPGPSPSDLNTLLTIASRVPDHGKLAPWRFIVFEGESQLTAGAAIAAAFVAKYPDATPDQIEFERRRLARAPLVIAVVSRAAPHEKIAGFVHIGRPTHAPEDRPRPALSDIVTRFG